MQDLTILRYVSVNTAYYWFQKNFDIYFIFLNFKTTEIVHSKLDDKTKSKKLLKLKHKMKRCISIHNLMKYFKTIDKQTICQSENTINDYATIDTATDSMYSSVDSELDCTEHKTPIDCNSCDSDYMTDIQIIDESVNDSKVDESDINFTPLKTSSKKNLVDFKSSKLYKNLTLIFDYKCDVCNLNLLKGQCIDCEYDDINDKFILLQHNLLSSTLITHDINEHKHIIEPNSVIDLLLLKILVEETSNRKSCKITHC